MLPSILERKSFAVEIKFLRILSIVASYVKSKCRALTEPYSSTILKLQIWERIWGREVPSPPSFTSTLLYLVQKMCTLRWYDTLEYGDFHENFNFLTIQNLRPLNTCQKHFEMILPNFPLDECEI